MRASSPRLTLAPICGSAMWARVMPTMSSLPSAIAWRAVATSLMRAAWNTGKRVAALTSPAKSRCGDEPPAALDPFRARDPLVPVLVGHQPGADDEVGADRLAHRIDDHEREAQA